MEELHAAEGAEFGEAKAGGAEIEPAAQADSYHPGSPSGMDYDLEDTSA